MTDYQKDKRSFLKHLHSWKRNRKAVKILVRYGLRTLSGQYFLPGPQRKPLAETMTADNFRRMFEELGPTFIKIGQFLSGRPDLIPAKFAEELEKLQDRVPGFGTEQVRGQLIRELGAPPEEIFAQFEYTPLASASIAQVHRARLKGGQQVAVKIRRPGLEEHLEEDLLMMNDLIGFLKKFPFWGGLWDTDEIIEIFSRQFTRELDFSNEALNMEIFRDIFAEKENIRLPQVFWEYTSRGILTMEYIPAKRIENVEVLLRGTSLGKELAADILKVVIVPFFQTGIFYGDPHAGNLMFADRKLVLFDFGIVARLDAGFRRQVAQLLLAIAGADVSLIMKLTLELSRETGPVNKEQLYEDLAAVIEKVKRLDGANVSLAEVINGMLEISLNHGLHMPGIFYSLGRAVLTGESIAVRLDPQLNVVETLRPLAAEYLKERLRPEIKAEKIYAQAGELAEKLGRIPVDMAQVIHRLAEGELSTVFIHRGLDELYRKLDIVSTRVAVSLIIGALLTGSAMIVSTLQPAARWFENLAAGGFLLALVLGLWMVWGMLRHGSLK